MPARYEQLDGKLAALTIIFGATQCRKPVDGEDWIWNDTGAAPMQICTAGQSARDGSAHGRVLVVASAGAAAKSIDLPVPTQGTEQWAGVVAKALTWGSKDKEESLQSLQAFKSKLDANAFKKGAIFEDATKGNIKQLLNDALSNAVDISAPVFFANFPSLISASAAAVEFGFTGIGVSPCVISIAPFGVGIFPTGVVVAPEGVSIGPTGVNIQPQGASISPTLIVIGPYDTTVAGQGFNIAPALIVVAPTKTVVNPTGPLAIGDALIEATVPALP